MADLLDALTKLQTVERQLSELRRAEEAIQRRLVTQQGKLAQIQSNHDEARQAMLAQQRKIDELGLEVAIREESAVKHRDALNKAKTNKEYANILTAINTEMADTSKIELEIKEFKEGMHKITDRVTALDTERAQVSQRIKAAEIEHQTFKDRTRAQREKLLGERQSFSHDIPASALSTFLRMAERHDGEAMVPVAKVHPRKEEFACTGCNIRVSMEVVNTLRAKGELQYCKVCGRILFIEDAKK